MNRRNVDNTAINESKSIQNQLQAARKIARLSEAQVDELTKKIQTQLRTMRKIAGLSQAEVAELMNMQRPTISQIENGSRAISAVELARFAALYQTTTTDLLGEVAECFTSSDLKLQIVAREIANLNSVDLDRLLMFMVIFKTCAVKITKS